MNPRLRFTTCFLLLFMLNPKPTSVAQNAAAATAVAEYRTDRILIMPGTDASPVELTDFHLRQSVKVAAQFPDIGGLQVLQLRENENVLAIIAKYQDSGLVDYAEPDFIRHLNATPNDPKFTDGTLWGLNNTGQSGGVADADIDAPEGWDVLNSASNIIVAVLDTGIRRSHEDLATNVWINPVDGGYGWNALTGTNTPADDEGHGSLVSGTLGAAGNNGKGVTGVAWRLQIMAGKCFNNLQAGSDSDIITCIEFATTNGAKIINASFDSPGYSISFSNAIYNARNAGIIFVASAGNNAINIDASPRFPACYDIDNIISVAASTRSNALWVSSNFGATNVDLVAPGNQITSTFFISDNSYIGPLSGTSFSAPYVAGACALMLVKYPAETHQQIIARVLNAADPLPALTGKCVTGGRLNLRKALSPTIQMMPLSTDGSLPFRLRVNAGPNRICVIESSADLATWSSVITNTTTAAGWFDYTNGVPVNTARKFFRAVSTL